MVTLNVPGTYSTIRAALIAAGNGDTIQIAAGSYDITAAGYNNSLAYSATPNCSTGFINGVTSLIYQGAGKFDPLNPYTSITGNARLFQKNVDGKAPASVVYTALDFLYTGGSGYILQTGDFGVSVANTVTKSIQIVNDSFRGTHTGNAGASGNYAAVLGIQNFVMADSSVSLTGQAGFNAAAGTGGSSFLMLNGGTGGSLVVSNNSFDEAGYRNALSIFDSVNVTLSANTFFRSSNRNVRGGGEKLKDTTGTVASNKFFDGSYLAVEKVSTGSVTVTGNIFAQFDPAGSTIPNPIDGGGAVGIVLQGASAASALGTVGGNTFSYVAPFVNTTTNAITIGPANSANSNVYVDPITNTTKNFNSYYVGKTNGDNLIGTTSPEYFIGGAGNDTITTNGGADYILFNTALNAATNVDTITGFNSSSRIILDRKIFKGISATYNGTTSSSIGAVNNSTQVENNTTGTASNAATRIIYNTNTGSLFYDQDGSGGTYAPIEFAKLYSSGTTPYNSTGMVGFNGTNLSSVNIGII
jgi:hypothetical protein